MRELLQQALDALIYHRDQTRPIERSDSAITALREALAAPMPEPVAKFHCYEMVDVGEVMLMPHTGPKLKHGDLLYTAPPAAPAPVVPLQGGMDNNELLAAWQKKLPGKVPEGQELNAFAVGTEVGFEHAQRLERMEWDRVHHVLAKHGKHPGRTDDHLADVIDKALSAAPVVREPQGVERMFAVREGLCNADETAYFAARPQLDDRVKRRIFIAGFYAGWDRGIGGGNG